MNLHFIGQKMGVMLEDMANSSRSRAVHHDIMELYRFSEKLRDGDQLSIKEFSECLNQLDDMMKLYPDRIEKLNKIQDLLTGNTASILHIPPVANVHYQGRLVGFANSRHRGEGTANPPLKDRKFS